MMTKKDSSSSGAQPPLEAARSNVSPRKQSAGGLPAIVSALTRSVAGMGVRRTLKTLRRLNQVNGFDCPGCAWPDPDGPRAHAEFCENGAKAVAEEATQARINADFFAHWSVANLAQKSDHWLGQQGRLTQPMWLAPETDHYQPVTWDGAFRIVATELKSLHTPDEAIFYTSGRSSNEAAFLYQLFVRMFGTNNLPDCSNMCHESSGVALGETIGVGKGTVRLDDFDLAQAIFIIGQNPGTNHPRMLTTLQRAKQRGCKIVHINPLPEAGMGYFQHPQSPGDLLGLGTKLADLFLQVRINGDVALLKGIMKAVIEAEAADVGNVLDAAFITAHTSGFANFRLLLNQVNWDDLVNQSGILQEQMRAAAQIFIASERTIFCWAMGLTQHRNAVANIQEIVNLLLLKGQIGKPGAGVCPVRGHSNVQGDRTMGICERPTKEFLDSLAQVFNFEPPRAHGYDTVNAIKAMHSGAARVLFALGGNFLSATPDTEFTAAALRRCNLTAHVSTKLNRSHLVTGSQALILPCLGRTEVDQQLAGAQFVTVENSMGIVHASTGTLAPASAELLSEPAIVARLAQVVLDQPGGPDWESLAADYDRIRDLIETTIPGFERFNERVRNKEVFYLPNPVHERSFNTIDGKARFTVHALPLHDLAPGQFMMLTMRSHDQFNTTIYGLDDRYRGVKNGRRVVFMHADDISELGLKPDDYVDLSNSSNGRERLARRFMVVPYSIPRGCVATYFPEANVLVPIESVAEKSNTPASKSVPVSIRPAE